MEDDVMTGMRVNACIVGGGPAGLMLGLLLAKRGASVLVLEGHETFDREFRGEVLQPSTARLLEELGLLRYLLDQPHSILEAGQVRLHGEDVGAFMFRRIAPAYPYAIWMPQPIFLAAMRRKAERLPTFQCWMGAHVTGLIEDDGRVLGVRGLRHGREPFEIRADVVVGADGRHSAVAKLGGFKAAYEHHDFDIVWFTVEQPAGWPNTLYISLGDGVRGLMLPKYPHHIQAGLVMRTGEWKQWRQDGVATVAHRIRRFDPVFDDFAGRLTDFKPFFPLQCTVRLVEDWARDGLLLIGDAAHTMSPVGAIGVNVAIATAVVAAQEIAPRLGRGPIPRAGLAAVQRIREADVRMLHRLQLQAQKVLIGPTRSSRLWRWLAPKALRLLMQSPLLPVLQRRVFLGPPLPAIDPAFRFQDQAAPPFGFPSPAVS
jgi:2-polyprenyl-6-methoxyphenol hydroxylase-like FAD-dependent oxidoreductase